MRIGPFNIQLFSKRPVGQESEGKPVAPPAASAKLEKLPLARFAEALRGLSDTDLGGEAARLSELAARKRRVPKDLPQRLAKVDEERSVREKLAKGPEGEYALGVHRMSTDELREEMKVQEARSRRRVAQTPDELRQAQQRLHLVRLEITRRTFGAERSPSGSI